jgi:cyclase
MLKKRLIFTLLYNNGTYVLSRNFRLQMVGNLEWLRENYNFDAIAFSIDELVVLNVSRDVSDMDIFSQQILHLSKNYYLPIAAGGGISSIDGAYKLLSSNVDKLVLNSQIIEKPELVMLLSKTFGSQCIVASIDCKKDKENYYVYIRSGSQNTNLMVEEFIKKAEDLGVGEIYLTSMDKDGTGFGYDLDLVERVAELTKVPIIVSGGVGKYQHLLDGLKFDCVTGASTANIYNFIVDGLTNARKYLKKNGIELPQWNCNLQDFYHCLH